MRDPHHSDRVRKVTILEKNTRGEAMPVIVYKKRGRKKKRKVSSENRPLDKFLLKRAKASQAFADSYVGRHRRSNRKKRDGALRDFLKNVTVALSKSLRRLA